MVLIYYLGFDCTACQSCVKHCFCLLANYTDYCEKRGSYFSRPRYYEIRSKCHSVCVARMQGQLMLKNIFLSQFLQMIRDLAAHLGKLPPREPRRDHVRS